MAATLLLGAFAVASVGDESSRADAACSIGTTTLRQTARGPAVNCLEQTLQAKGYQSTYIDEYFGSTTVTAVTNYQRDNGLYADGIVGPQTGQSLGIWGGTTTTTAPPPTTTAPTTTPPPTTTAPTSTAPSTTTPTTPSTGLPCWIGTTTLRSGSTGTQVNCLERTLQAKGYQSTYIDNYYRSTTVASVINYQRDNGLYVDGIVGPQTGQSLGIWGNSTTTPTTPSTTTPTTPSTTTPTTPSTTTPTTPSTGLPCWIGTTTLRSGSTGTQVNCLERTLQAKGYQSTYIDNYYRSTTVASVINYQRDNGLYVDGIVGPQTGQSLGIWGNSTSGAARIVETRVIGSSVQGRNITAYRLGSPGGTPVLAVGLLHGDEDDGVRIARYIRDSAQIPAGLDVWVILDANPDGNAANRRQNANGVDLNRNFDSGDWQAIGQGTEKYSGPSAASEPETQALQSFITSTRPKLAVWWHQVGNHVDDNRDVANYSLLGQFGVLTMQPVLSTSCVTVCAGTATSFVNRTVSGATSFVVEMPSSYSDSTVRSQANGFLTVAARS